MKQKDTKIKDTSPDRNGRSSDKQSWYEKAVRSRGLIFWIILFSFGFHALTLIKLDRIAGYFSHSPNMVAGKKYEKLNLKFQPKPKKKIAKKEEKPKDESARTIIETELEKTEAPKNAKFLGVNDHKAKKQTRAKETGKRSENNKSLGNAGKDDGNAVVRKKVGKENILSQKASKASDKKSKKKILTDANGVVSVDASKSQKKGSGKEKSAYELLIPTSQDLTRQVKKGYNEYIDESLPEGDVVDVDTTNYRFVGYFTSMKKSVELVLDYPIDAVRRGIQGKVDLGFIISKDGTVNKIQVIKSSGYEILDNAWVEAIKLASPFSPLPKNMKKEILPVRYSVKFALGN